MFQENENKYLTLRQVLEAIDQEEEFDGDIPPDVFSVAASSAMAMAEALRLACILTKRGIKERVSKLQSEPAIPLSNFSIPYTPYIDRTDADQ